MKVLIVEDDPVTSHAVAGVLESNHIESEITGTLAGGIAALQRGGWDAVLLDLMLPNGEGMAVIDAVQKIRPDTPMVVLTGTAKDTMQDAMHHGAQEFLIKPAAADSLIRAIDRAVARHVVRPIFVPLEDTLKKMLEV